MSTLAIIALLLVALALATNASVSPLSIFTTGGTTRRIAEAIANAEGYFVQGSLPRRLNNPGSLKLDGQRLTSFPSANDGWTALYRQVDMMLSGRSAFYNPSMSIMDLAYVYTGGDNPETWAQNVSAWLGVSPYTTLGSV